MIAGNGGDPDVARKFFSGPCEFVAGAATLESLPPSHLPEIAFVGRSNSGKSSLINAITRRSRLARVSHTPGRTQQINLYRIADRLLLADLPGYGFARVSKAESVAWNELIAGYLRFRRNLRRVLLLIDARRGRMESDENAMTLLDNSATAFQIVLAKTDLLAPAALDRVVAATAEMAASHPAALPEILATAAKSGAGIAEIRQSLVQLAAR